MSFPSALVDGIGFSWKKGVPAPDEPVFNDQLLLHDEYELFYLIAGDLTWFVDSSTYAQKPGSLLILNSREVHKLQVRSQGPYERVKLLFPPELARSLDFPGVGLLSCFEDRPNGEGNLLLLDPKGRVAIQKLFERLRDARGGADAPLVSLIVLAEILLLVKRAYGNAAGPEAPDASQEKLLPLLDYIDGNLGGDLSLERLGERCGFSVSHLSRMFKKHSGGNLHDYILYKRVAKAKLLLADGWKVKDARAACGFGNDSAFIAVFKKIAGVTPAAYRRSGARP